jgi:hypothetical protein
MTALVWAGEVSADARGKRVLSGRCVLAGGETGPFRCRCEDRGPRPAETLAATGRPAYTGVGSGESKRKSRLILETTEPLPIEKDSERLPLQIPVRAAWPAQLKLVFEGGGLFALLSAELFLAVTRSDVSPAADSHVE